MDDKKIQINLKYDDKVIKGKHGTDVMIATTDKDVCLTFIVPGLIPNEAIVTSRMFIPHSTALQMAKLIEQRLKPADDLLQKLKGLIPPTEDAAGPRN